MNHPQPSANAIVAQAQRVPEAFAEAGENDVNRDHICVEAIDPRRINEIRNNSAPAIAPAPNVIRQKPPDICEQVRPRDAGDAMPNHGREVDIVNTHAVDVKFVVVCEAGDKLRHAALGAVSFIYEGRNDGDAQARHGGRRYEWTFIASHHRVKTNKFQMRDQPTAFGARWNLFQIRAMA